MEDYLLNDNVKGILVEPVKHLFTELKENFKSNSNFHFENAAIYKRNGKKSFFRVNANKENKLPQWTQGLGSFNKNNIDLHNADINFISKFILKETVNCITFKSLLKKYKVDHISILQIDTEGYDFDILKTIDFNLIRPDIIIIEYLHITTYQYFAALNLLQNHNYKVSKNKDAFDLIAIDNQIL